MSDEIEWGPWIEHDGKGCPLEAGLVCQIHVRDQFDGTEIFIVVVVGEPWSIGPWFGDGSRDDWVNGDDWREHDHDVHFIRYRIRKPRSTAMDRLAEIVASPSTPITAPEGPTREMVPANNTRDRA